MAIIDSQSVRIAEESGGHKGYEAGKSRDSHGPQYTSSTNQPPDIFALLVAEKGRLAGAGVLSYATRISRGGDGAGHSLVGEDELE